MILQSLVSYYEELTKKDLIPKPGWSKIRVQFALEIDAEGKLLSVQPLERMNEKGKPIPRYFEMPTMVKRTVGIDSNFLWDNGAYLLGLDGKGNKQRAIKCFENAKENHLKLLSGVDSPFAKAIINFFSTWTPENAAVNPVLAEHLENLAAGSNLTFMYMGKMPDTERSLAEAWQKHYNGSDDDETTGKMVCLVTGEKTVPAPVHPSIMKVSGAQSSGAALVSFNAYAFCS